MILRLLKRADGEPIVLADVERQTRIEDLSSESVEIDLFIQAIRQQAEAVTRRALLTQQWELSLDAFPSGRSPLEIPRPPLVSVDSITYTDTAGNSVTLDPPLYRMVSDLAPNGQPGFIVPAYGTSWPQALDDAGAVQVTFTAGYGDKPGDVPAGIRQWMLINIANLYENRESQTVASGRLTEVDLSTMADSLLADFRIYGW